MQSNENGIRSKGQGREESRKGNREEESGDLEEVGAVCGVCSEKHPDAECELRMLWSECAQRAEQAHFGGCNTCRCGGNTGQSDS